MKIALLGAGAWGTSIASLFADNGHQVVMYGHNPQHNDINLIHRNTPVFPDVVLSNLISFSFSLPETINDADIIVFSVPSKSYRSVAKDVSLLLKKKVHIISTAKGFDPTSFERLSIVLREEIPEKKRFPIVTLIGPSYASEVIKGLMTCVTAVSVKEEEAKFVQKVMSGPHFRVYTNNDEIGSECSAALKNVMAIGAGILIGLGEGENARAALVTRGLKEIMRFGLSLGGKTQTFYGLTGIGDLLLTCNSMKSRNFNLGYQIGKSDDALSVLKNNTKTCEGVDTSKYAYLMSKKLGIEMPITEAVYKILFESTTPSLASRSLMARELKPE